MTTLSEQSRLMLEKLGDLCQPPVLVKETEWSREFLIAPNSIFYESRFLADKLQIKPETLISRWGTMKASEKHDFALAFQSKESLSDDDQTILRFLMDFPDETVWLRITPLLSMHSNKEEVSNFLLRRLQSPPTEGNRVVYYAAVEGVATSEHLAQLKGHFNAHQAKVAAGTEVTEGSLWDFVQLCETLLKLTEEQTYLHSLVSLKDHPSKLIRSKVQRLLAQHARRKT